ncbi:thiamine biosynthesis protein [Corynebacterium diphtheriae]|nr:thiamine biosynthesis protein [Corynebacterium diphtheriae]
MTHRIRRSLTTAAAILALGAAISACSPPHQIDSDAKVDTATSAKVAQPSAASESAMAAPSDDKNAEIKASATENLTNGQNITVELSGLNPEVGYYAAICNAATPTGAPAPLCTGQHADTSAQAWIKADGTGTTILNSDGTATVTLTAAATGQGVDCKTDKCVIKVFGDHTEGFRDVTEVPVTFAS